VSICGSYASEKEREESDFDILIELKHPVGLMELSRYKNDLEELIDVPVDIGTNLGFSEYVANEMIDNSIVIQEDF
jgi:predicted nucleotidyltransferase